MLNTLSTSGSDADLLLEKALTGDETALGELLEKYRGYLTLLARFQIGRRLQVKLDASDVVQDAFLGALRDFEQFRGTTEKELSAWLRQVLAHVLANTVRHYQGTQQRDIRLERQLITDMDQSAVGMNQAFIAPGNSPSQSIARRELGLVLAEALTRLPPADGDLLVLRHFEGLTFPAIAERLGRTLDSVKKQWPGALVRLRQSVKELWHDSEEQS